MENSTHVNLVMILFCLEEPSLERKGKAIVIAKNTNFVTAVNALSPMPKAKFFACQVFHSILLAFVEGNRKLKAEPLTAA
eukprot:5099172-Ditylum_brightwellii.AAC.1